MLHKFWSCAISMVCIEDYNDLEHRQKKCLNQHVWHTFIMSLIIITQLFFFYTNRIFIISLTFRSRSPDEKKPCFITEGPFCTQPPTFGPVSKPRFLIKVFLQIAAYLWLLEVNVIFNSLNKQHFFSPRQKMLSARKLSRYFKYI